MQIFLNGLISGLTISILALGFVVVYLPTKVFHIALGAIYTLVPFITWSLLDKVPWWTAISTSIACGALASLLCELLNHRFLEQKRASSGAHLVSSLGIYIFLTQTIALIWGNETKVLRQGLDNILILGDVLVTHAQIMAGTVSLILIFTFFLWLKFSNLGLQFRALASNPKELALRGYNLYRLRTIAFCISGFFCAIAALLVTYDISFNPNVGLSAILLAVVAVIIGGRQSFFGAVLGGLLLGVVRSEVVWFFSARWQETITFALLALFIYIRPNGIIANKARLEADS